MSNTKNTSALDLTRRILNILGDIAKGPARNAREVYTSVDSVGSIEDEEDDTTKDSKKK